MKTFNARFGAWALLLSLLGSPFATILHAQIPLGEALDDPILVWVTTGAVPWGGDNGFTHDDVDAARSGAIPDAASSGVQTTVSVGGTITFWWKVSCELDNDALIFLINGVEQTRISGEVEWHQHTIVVPAGGRTLEWRYSKNAGLAAGHDRAWLDQVQFLPNCSFFVTPLGRSHGYGATTGIVSISTSPGCPWNTIANDPWITILSGASGVDDGQVVYAVAANTNMQPREGTITIAGRNLTLYQVGHYYVSPPVDQNVAVGDTATFSVSVNGIPPFTYQWQFNGVDLADGGSVSGATTSTLVLTDVKYLHGGHYRVVVRDADSTAISSSATLTVAPFSNTVAFAEALDTGDMLFWKTWSDSRGNWFGQPNTTHDGVDALECSGLAPGAYASLEAKSGGAGMLSFWWKTVFTAAADQLLFSIGGSQSALVTNTMNWEQRTFNVPPGDVNLRWTFSNSSTGEQSKAWLDQVQFTPCSFSLSPDGTINNFLAYTGKVTLNAAANCSWNVVNTNSWITILSSMINSGSGSVTFGIAANPMIAGRTGYITIAEQSFFIYQSLGPSTNAGISLAEGLDTGGVFEWSTIGTPEWFGQTMLSRDGADAAQSGPVGDGGAVTATTTVPGPGTLFFWWKVSSETNKDYLKFFINGVQQTRISGEVDWQLMSYNLAPGASMLKWTYSKNADTALGQDRGWLDQVQFVPTPETGACVIAVSPITATHSASVGTGSVYVAAATACGWNVVNTNSWITTLAVPIESNGFVRYAVSTNNSRTPRTGVLLIGSQPFTVTQANGLPPCTYSISPMSRTLSYGSSSGTISVTTPSGCEWNVVNTNAWITITSSPTNSGGGQVSYSVSQNNSYVARSGQIGIEGQIFTVSQGGAPLTLAEALDTVGIPLTWFNLGNLWIGQTSVTHDGVDAAQSGAVTNGLFPSLRTAVNGPGTLTFWWKVSSATNNHFLRFFTGAFEEAGISGEVDWQQRTVAIPPGSYGFEWRYAKNGALPSGQDRGWIDQVQFIPTAGCPATLSSTNASHPSGSSTGLVSVAAAADCAWSVFNTNTWISIVSGSNGIGNGSVTYMVAANPTASVRSGNVWIANQIFLVTQSDCSISILPGSRTHGFGSATDTVSITTPAGCWWSVFNSNAWITIVSPPSVNWSNSGSGQLIYSVSENSTPFARSGNIYIGGELFAITQSASPLTLAEALDTIGTPLVWNSGGSFPWAGTISVTHDGIDAAFSGGIGDNAASSFRTSVNGPGTLTFWWKVSSETNSDTLRLFVRGFEQARISGAVDWQQRTVAILPGVYNLEWVYAKNSALSAGQDRGWVDQIQFVPGAACPISLSPISASHGSDSSTGIVGITASGCAWSVVNTNPWISIVSATSTNEAGSGTLVYTVDANPSASVRSGNIRIDGESFILTQSGTPQITTNAPQLHFVGRPGNGATLSLEGETGGMYVVECSEDLIHWIPISTNSAPATVTDAPVGNAPRRFYRAVEIR